VLRQIETCREVAAAIEKHIGDKPRTKIPPRARQRR
jgi:hypothetical protein